MKTVKFYIGSSFQKEEGKKKIKKIKRKCLDATYRFSYIKFILVHYHHKELSLSLSLSLSNIYILDVIALKTLSYGKSISEIVIRD